MTNFQDLNGRVAVVTGGARGIGKAVAEALVQRGAKVAVGDLLAKEGQEFIDQLNQKFACTFGLASKEFGGVDIAILNAGTAEGASGPLTPMDDEADMQIFNVNLGGVVKGTKLALLHLAKRGGGVIVNTASIAGFTTFYGMNAYNASKHAVVGWTRSLDNLPELCGVRVNAVCPYFMQTDILNFAKASPFASLIEKFSKTSMATVVEAFLRCISDETLVGATLLCLADGIEEADRYQAPPSCINEESAQELMNLGTKVQELGKADLEEAIARAKI